MTDRNPFNEVRRFGIYDQRYASEVCPPNVPVLSIEFVSIGLILLTGIEKDVIPEETLSLFLIPKEEDLFKYVHYKKYIKVLRIPDQVDFRGVHGDLYSWGLISETVPRTIFYPRIFINDPVVGGRLITGQDLSRYNVRYWQKRGT